MARRPASTDRHLEALKKAFARHQQGDRAGAITDLDRILRADPRHAGAHRVAALVHHAARDHDRALYHAEKAASIDTKSSQTLTLLGTVLDARGEHERALDAMRRAIDLNPRDVEGLTTLALTLDALDRHDEAIEIHTRALEINPDHAVAATNAALSLLMVGRARDATDLLRRLAGRQPGDAHVAERLAYCLNYDDRATRAEINAAHRRWGALVERATPAATPRAIDKAGRLRLALISPDFRRHSVANFVRPIFDHLDRSRFELHAIFTSARADDVTETLRPLADRWHDAAALSDAEIAALVAREKIDVLVDLCGHFAGHRLGALARRPAPLQITWLGYPATTGLTRIDARLVDTATDPVERTDAAPPAHRESERLVRLDPCFLCYTPPAEAPDPAPAPPSAGGQPFTFASFNDIKKISPATLDLWSAVLARTPGSRLLIKAGPLASPGVRGQLHAAFEARGVDPARVALDGHTPGLAEHLRTYHAIDLALDTYPYHGTTTTCEALWMGVPVVTRAGDPHAARVGVSLLTAVALPELIAHDADGYIDRAVRLATDPAALASVRTGLRDRVAASPLIDAPAFAARFAEAVLRLASGPADP